MIQIKSTECLIKATDFKVDQKTDLRYEIYTKPSILFYKISSDGRSECKKEIEGIVSKKIENKLSCL